MTAALKRSFESLEVPNYRRYFTGQVVSISGNWMQSVAEVWLILSLTGSGFLVGITTALQFLPILLVGAWGGALADRFSKRSLLLVTQAAMMLPPLILFAVTTTGAVQPWMVLSLVFVRGVLLAADNPARQAFVMEIVGPGPDRQRGQPQQRHGPLGQGHRPGRRRHPDRDPRGGSLLRPERRHLRGDVLGAAGHRPAFDQRLTHGPRRPIAG